VGVLAWFGELLACEVQEPLRCYKRFVAVVDVEAELDEEIDQQPHVVQQDGEPEVEQPDVEVLGCGPGEEVLDRLVGVLDAPPPAVSIDHAFRVFPFDLRPRFDVFVRHEGHRLFVVGRRREEDRFAAPRSWVPPPLTGP